MALYFSKSRSSSDSQEHKSKTSQKRCCDEDGKSGGTYFTDARLVNVRFFEALLSCELKLKLI